MNDDEHNPYFVKEPAPTAAEWLLSLICVVVLILISAGIYFWR